jgi:hypothetical protein
MNESLEICREIGGLVPSNQKVALADENAHPSAGTSQTEALGTSE